MQIWNKYSKTGIILCALGVFLFLLWAIWLSEGNGISSFVSTGSIIAAIILFLGGVFSIYNNSGDNSTKE